MIDDPRIEAVVGALIEHGHNGIDCYHAMSLDDTVEDVILAADAADKAADPPWIRIRCDEATEERAIQALMRWINRPDAAMMARAVLAALPVETQP